MTSQDWSTLAGLREIQRVRSDRICGWTAPVTYAVGFHTGGDWAFPHVNLPTGTHGLPAVILAEVLGHSSGTHEYRLTNTQLAQAIATLEPAEAATGVEHPNLVSWRTIAAEQPQEIAAVFVGSLDDPTAGPADRALRQMLAPA